MKKGILITIIAIIIIGIAYFGIEMFGFAKGVKEDAKKENLNAELNAQTQFSGYPTSDKVEFNIKAGKEYYAGKPIEIKLIWKTPWTTRLRKTVFFAYCSSRWIGLSSPVN